MATILQRCHGNRLSLTVSRQRKCAKGAILPSLSMVNAKGDETVATVLNKPVSPKYHLKNDQAVLEFSRIHATASTFILVRCYLSSGQSDAILPSSSVDLNLHSACEQVVWQAPYLVKYPKLGVQMPDGSVIRQNNPCRKSTAFVSPESAY